VTISRLSVGLVGWCVLGCVGTPPAQVPNGPTSPAAPTAATSSPTSGHSPSGEVRQEPAVPNEGVTPAAVRATVLSRQSTFQACFERGLERDPSLGGAVVIAVAVSPEGNVSRATAIYPQPEAAPARGSQSHGATTLPDNVVVECVLGVFRNLRFPASGGGTAFSYPLVFHGKAAADATPPDHVSATGTPTDPKEVVRYKDRLASWFNAHFRQPTNVPAHVLEGLYVSATVNVGEGRRITRVDVRRWSGNDSFDAATRLAVSALTEQQLPEPPAGYPDIVGTSLGIRFAGRSPISVSH